MLTSPFPSIQGQGSTLCYLPVHGSAVWPSNGSFGVYKGSEGSKTDGSGQGYKDPPVTRWLVASGPLSGNLFTTYLDPIANPSITASGGWKKTMG